MGRKISIQITVKRFIVFFLSWCITPLVSGQGTPDTGSLQAFVDNWLAAWQRQDTDAYFRHYHDEFIPAGYDDREAWRQARIRNITRPESIAIEREDFSVRIREDDQATVTFHFVYRSPDYADRTEKELGLVISGGEIVGISSEINLAVERLPLVRVPADNPAGVELDQATEPMPEEVSRNTPAVEPSTAGTVDAFASPTEQSPAQSPTPAPRGVASADWVPPGFENLNQPQVTEIDVYYGGYFLTSVLAEFTDSQVTVIDIPGLMENLKDLKNPESFQVLLNQPLDAHVGEICYSEFQTDCGVLETESVEVIFDRSMLRMWLFIGPELLLAAEDSLIRFLPPSEAGLSFLNQTAAYFTAQDLSLDNYNLFNNTLFAWGENRLSMRSNLVSDEGFDIDTMAFYREFEGRDYHVGLMRENANGFSFMANERFAGASYASSLLTRTDLEQSLGTVIELYFSTRSRVEIYQEGRLISTDYYGVGNHILDTSNLPNGSYTIEIRIIDAAGVETIEERYYAKTARIAPADQPLYFIHIGRLENELDVNRLSRTGQDELMVRGGYSMRLGQSLGGNIGFSHVDDSSFVELGFFKQGRSYELQANAAYEDTGATGLDFRWRFRHSRFNLTLNGRQVFNGLQESQIGLDYRQYNAMLEVPTRRGFFSFFHRHVERPQTGQNLNSGFRYRSRPWEFAGGMLSNNLEFSKNDEEVLALWTFSWALQGANRSTIYSPTATYANEHSNRDSGLYGSYQSNWFGGSPGGNDYNFSLRGDYDTQSTMEARFEADTQMGSTDITGRYNEINEQLEMSGRISTSFATDGRTSAIGGKRRSESAFLVRVDGDIEAGARFNVLVNGAVRGQLNAGETRLIPVAPYNTYNIELQAIGDTLVTLENRIYRETMYPGNVVNLNWSTRVINIAIGRLVDETGNPLGSAVIQNVVGIAMADDNGFFQAEIDHNTETLDVIRGTTQCRAAFSNPRINDTILPLGTLVCR